MNFPVIYQVVAAVLTIDTTESAAMVLLPVPAVPSPRCKVSVVMASVIAPAPVALTIVMIVPNGYATLPFAGIVKVVAVEVCNKYLVRIANNHRVRLSSSVDCCRCPAES